MRKTEYVERLEHPNKKVKVFEVSEVLGEMRSYDTACSSALIDILNRDIPSSHRMDMLFQLPSNLRLMDLYGLIPPYNRIFYKYYACGAQVVLVKNDNLTGEHRFLNTFPIVPPILKRTYGESYKMVIQQESKPILLRRNGIKTFACIDKYQIIGLIKGDYLPTMPLFTYKGAICINETNQLLRTAAPYIYSRLPFTDKELDVIEELANGKDNKAIGNSLKITSLTVKEHRKNINKSLKLKNISKDWSNGDVANNLRFLKIL